LTKIFVKVPGILEKLYVKDGMEVEEGTVLAEFRNPVLDNQHEENLAQYQIRDGNLAILKQQLSDPNLRDPSEVASMRQMMAKLGGERESYRRQLEVDEELKAKLQLRAAQEGRV